MITKENLIRTMEIVETSMDGHLTYRAFQFLDRNLRSVVELEEFLSIKLETLFNILKRDSLDMDESFVLDLALKWAGKECERKNLESTAENKRQVLGKVFFEIRFGLLAPDRISDLVSSNLLSARESLDLVLEDGYVTTADHSTAKRIKLNPEVGFKSNPRIFGLKMEEKLKERNKYYLNALAESQAEADAQVHLIMSEFPRNKTEDELRNEIQRARSVFDLKVEKSSEAEEFLVNFKYNSSKYRKTELLDPVWYGFQYLNLIQIMDWGDDVTNDEHYFV